MHAPGARRLATITLTSGRFHEVKRIFAELGAMVLSLSGPALSDAALTCRYEVLAVALAVRVSAPVDETAELPAEQSFEWRVLTTNATGVRGSVTAGRAWIELRKPRP